jgi:hypothetical protein
MKGKLAIACRRVVSCPTQCHAPAFLQNATLESRKLSMEHAARGPISILLLLLLGCSGDPSGPSGNSLAVSIQGLPSGSPASVSVNGPNGYGQALTSSQTLTGLTPGVYTVSASGVTVGSVPYQASPSSQTVSVGGSSPAQASVVYSTPTGNLAITVNGLGTSNEALITVTGPSYTKQVTTSETLTGLAPGDYTIDAQNTTAFCGSTFTVTPTTQPAAVTASATTNVSVSYNSTPSGILNLCVDGMYLTQSAQNYAGTVPVVQARNGLLRIFVVADQANAATPVVRVRFYNDPNPTPVLTQDIPAPAGMLGVATAPDESSLSNSWNYVVPGSMIVPGLRIEAEVDPGLLVPESNDGDNVLAPAALDVRAVPTVNVTFVPVLQRGIPLNRRFAGNVTTSNKAAFLQTTQSMHPIASINSDVHSPYTTTTTDTLEDGNGNNAWGTILNELDVLRTAEASTRYFYGVAKVAYGTGVAGVAYVSNPSVFPPQVARVALGWDYLPSGGTVVAHELGHNWARNHAPCGGPTGVDPNYPRSDGSTGSYGYDASAGIVEPPSSTDIMGYCNAQWISEYTYSGVLSYLTSVSPLIQRGVVSPVVQPCLVVWGHVRNGELVLEPAFQVNTRPSLPRQAGPYSLEGRASDGSRIFGLSFTPNEIADAPGSQQNFTYAVPLSSSQASRLQSLHLSGYGRPAMRTAVAAQSQPLEVRRVNPGSVGLRWDARVNPMIMVRDPDTGEVLSLARGGDVELSTTKRQVDLVISDGVKSRVQRTAVMP